MSTDNLSGIYLRAGVKDNEPASANFTFMEVDCRLFIQADGTIVVHKIGSKGEPTAKPIATGQWAWADKPADKRPNLSGIFTTGKQSVFEIAGWLHTDQVLGDEYVSLTVRPRLHRAGFFPGRQNAEA